MDVMPGKFVCPVCLIDHSARGTFDSIRRISLHIAGMARTWHDEHEQFVLNLMPGANLDQLTVNQIDSEIRYYVQEALEQLWVKSELEIQILRGLINEQLNELVSEEKADSAETTSSKAANPISDDTTIPLEMQGRSTQECERYVSAYRCIWEIETRLHRFVALCLGEKHGHRWVEYLPPKVRDKCIQRFDDDGRRVRWECYMDLLDFSEITKSNKEAFSGAFERLQEAFKDPVSEFHSGLRRVNDIRKGVMHPLRGTTPTDEELTTLEQYAEIIKTFTSFG